MRILHFIYSLQPAGAECMLIDIVNEQVNKENVGVLILNDDYDTDLITKINSQVNVLYVNRPKRSINPFYILKLNLLILKFAPAIIHCHNYSATKLIFIKAVKLLTVHNIGIPTSCHRRYTKLFSISDSVGEDVLQRSNIRSIVVNNGINIHNISVKEDYCSITFKIVQVGRLYHTQKGQHVLIQAVKILKEKYCDKKITLDFIGEGDSYAFLKSLVEELDLIDIVRFCGEQKREFIYSNLKNYSLLVQPSIFEGFGLTVVEGMAAKLPVLCSNVDGPMEILKNGEYGTLFNSNSSSSCAHKLMEIMENYNEKIVVATKARDYVEANFSVKRTALSYLSEYKIIYAGKS